MGVLDLTVGLITATLTCLRNVHIRHLERLAPVETAAMYLQTVCGYLCFEVRQVIDKALYDSGIKVSA